MWLLQICSTDSLTKRGVLIMLRRHVLLCLLLLTDASHLVHHAWLAKLVSLLARGSWHHGWTTTWLITAIFLATWCALIVAIAVG